MSRQSCLVIHHHHHGYALLAFFGIENRTLWSPLQIHRFCRKNRAPHICRCFLCFDDVHVSCILCCIPSFLLSQSNTIILLFQTRQTSPQMNSISKLGFLSARSVCLYQSSMTSASNGLLMRVLVLYCLCSNFSCLSSLSNGWWSVRVDPLLSKLRYKNRVIVFNHELICKILGLKTTLESWGSLGIQKGWTNSNSCIGMEIELKLQSASLLLKTVRIESLSWGLLPY